MGRVKDHYMDEINHAARVHEEYGEGANPNSYVTCEQCGELIEKDLVPDGCRDPDCPMQE